MKLNRYLTVFGIALFAITSCEKENQQAMAQFELSLPATQITTKDITAYQEFPTNIEGKVNNDVRAKISGYITHVYIDEGQYVSKGQALFKLETDVQSQDANAASSAIGAAQANIDAAQAAVNAAQLEVDRLRPLVEKNIIGGVQLETAQANLMRAQGQLEQAKAGKKQAEAGLSAVQANINYGVVRSPISGVIGTINYREGSLVGPGDPTPITSVSEVGEVYAYFSMNESEYFNFLEQTEGANIKEKLNHLSEVDLVLPNGQVYSEKGKIKTVTGQINPATGTIQFRATFPNKDRLLSNGNSGTIRIPKDYENALIIPISATYERQGNTFVYKVKNDTVYNTMISIENNVGNTAIIGSGLEKGDVIVIQGLNKLRDGVPLKAEMTDFETAIAPIKPIM